MKIELGAYPFIYPIPIVLAGAIVEGKPNYVTVGDCGLMGINPPLVYISLHENHYTTQGVIKQYSFSINIPSTDLLTKVDYCGIVSGADCNKAILFETFYGDLRDAPLITECPVNIECKVIHDFKVKHRHVFVGEVIQTHISEEYVCEQDGKRRIAGMTQLDPIIYAMDNRYYRIGAPIGTGYQEGRNLIDRNDTEDIT